MSVFEILLVWPDQLVVENFALGTLERSACLLRLGRLQESEVCLLAFISANSPEPFEALALLGFLRLLQGSLLLASEVLKKLERIDSDSWQYRWLLANLLIQRGKLDELVKQPHAFWREVSQYQHLANTYVAFALIRRDFSLAENLLKQFPVPFNLEALRLQAGLLSGRGQAAAAFQLLRPALARAPLDRQLHVQVFDLVIAARIANQIVPTAREVVSRHGEHPDVLNNVTAVKLFQRQPGYGRRSALILQTWASVGRAKPGCPNQICSYEQCGQVNWLEYLHPIIRANPLADPILSGNIACHLASLESSWYAEHMQLFVNSLLALPEQKQYASAQPLIKPLNRGSQNKSKTIAWVTGDLQPHPVSRFLQHFLEASHDHRLHKHILVSTMDNGTESIVPIFQAMPGVDVVEVSHLRGKDCVSAIRSLQADLAVDLSGWTGGNFSRGFLARYAQVQVNYLGYFASSGLPTMDYWLGDKELFPEPMNEWHTEKIWRLDRPFLAWQPPNDLPEGSAELTPAPSGDICFGSFNHTRKLSDRTLRLWGRILNDLPGSTLVLKASANEDQPTQLILRRRMMRNGLDPECVTWLGFTGTCEEHLQQYRHIDIALDPIPNGGCTTTCEALWMGVPVITLEGKHYVSRMSTAVLRAAGLDNWVCSSEDDYYQLCVNAASQLLSLRSTRHQWRNLIQASKLGDASNHMKALEAAFSLMINEQVLVN